jgi:hypothetical protein
MAVDAVVDILRAAAEASQQQISHSLVRLLSKLAAHAEHGTLNSRPVADQGLRDAVRRLVADWDLKDPNPGAYGLALERIAKGLPTSKPTGKAAHGTDRERLIQTALEIGVVGPRVERAVDSLIDEGMHESLLAIIEQGPPSAALTEIRGKVASESVLGAVLAVEPLDLATLDRLIALMGAQSAAPMVDALAAAESRSVRRHLINRLIALGSAIVPVIMNRIGDERWYVVRNLLMLIDELPESPPGFVISHFTTHPDSRVRRQALKMQIGMNSERETALTTALSDPDPEVVRLGLLGLEKSIPRSLEHKIEQIATNQEFSYEIREVAIRALGYSRSQTALAILLALVDGGQTILGRQRLAPKSPGMLAALRALSVGWKSHPMVSEIMARALASSDQAIRGAVTPVKET